MFNRKVVNTMVGKENRQTSPNRSCFHHRRSEPSPAKRLFTLIKSGFTPSKKTPKVTWKQSTTEGANRKPALYPTSYAAALTRDDSKSLTYSTSPSSSASTLSECGMVKLSRWASTSCDANIASSRHQYNSPMPSFATLAKLPFSPTPAGPLVRERREKHHRQQQYYARCDDDLDSQGSEWDTSISEDSFNHYDFCLGKSYEFALDNDLAIERKRYYESEKSVLIDGAEEKEFIKTFNRKKFKRRIFANKKTSEALGKKYGSNTGK